jgi:hypothetical protein
VRVNHLPLLILDQQRVGAVQHTRPAQRHCRRVLVGVNALATCQVGCQRDDLSQPTALPLRPSAISRYQ